MSELEEAKARAKQAYEKSKPAKAEWLELAMPYFSDPSLVPDENAVLTIEEARQRMMAAIDAFMHAMGEVMRLEPDPEKLLPWLEEIT